MDRLNYFNLFDSKAADHEDQLTRAFLVTVRLVPSVLSVLLDLIREQQSERGSDRLLSPTSELLAGDFEVRTQVTSLSSLTGRLVSVVMTDERREIKDEVAASDRGARYDGVLSFSASWIITIENKPRAVNIWEGQIHPSLPDKHEIEIDRNAVVVQWGHVVDRLSRLADDGILNLTERLIVDDFLQYIDARYSFLNPYDTFGKCKKNRRLIDRRCQALLTDLQLGPVQQGLGWKTQYVVVNNRSSVRMIGLFPVPKDGDEVQGIRLELYPGDTLTQARSLYPHLADVGSQRLFSLADQGWALGSNFHFGVMQKGKGYGITTHLSFEEYVQYWIAHVDSCRSIDLTEQPIEDALQAFVGTGMMDASDIDKVRSKLPRTGSKVKVSVRPGIMMQYDWPLSNAVDLDNQRKMAEEIKQRVEQALAVVP